jgi:hypothetical protein
MLSRKLPKRLFKSKDVVHAYEHDRMTKGAVKHMERDHVDVLQNIEFSLVTQARDDPTIDDTVIDDALRVCIDRAEPSDGADSRVAALCGMLKSTRSLRQDVSDEIWAAGLRRIQKSVRLHSNLVPGETSYLDFVRPYVR